MPTLGNTPRPGYVYDTETDTWVPIGVGAHTHAYIPNTLVDAKGDILTATANDVPARLGIGANGTVLVSDSTTSTGLSWQPYAAQVVAGKNKLINGDMSIWQRGTSFTGGYTADRWTMDGGTVTRSTSAPSGFAYSLQIANAPGNPAIRQGIELPAAGVAGQFAVGTTWTISCYAKVSTTVTSQLTLFACFNNGVNSGVSVQLVNNTVGIPTTAWQRFSTTFTIVSSPAGTDTCLMFVPYLANGAYAGNFNITGLQIEQGSVATPFTTATGTIQGELAACQRYYWRTNRESQGSSSRITPYGIAQTTTAAEINFYLPTAMRTKPSSVEYANLRTYDGATLQSVTSVGIGDGSSTSINLGFSVASGLVQYRPTAVALNGDGYLALSAEL